MGLINSFGEFIVIHLFRIIISSVAHSLLDKCSRTKKIAIHTRVLTAVLRVLLFAYIIPFFFATISVICRHERTARLYLTLSCTCNHKTERKISQRQGKQCTFASFDTTTSYVNMSTDVFVGGGAAARLITLTMR